LILGARYRFQQVADHKTVNCQCLWLCAIVSRCGFLDFTGVSFSLSGFLDIVPERDLRQTGSVIALSTSELYLFPALLWPAKVSLPDTQFTISCSVVRPRSSRGPHYKRAGGEAAIGAHLRPPGIKFSGWIHPTKFQELAPIDKKEGKELYPTINSCL
jgi:hypothetical protein